MGCYVPKIDQLQIRCCSGGMNQRFNSWNAASRENIALDEVHFIPGTEILAIIDRNGLDEHEALRLQELAALSEERFEKLMADGLDHFDGDELVVLALKVSVVFFEERNTILKSFGLDSFQRQLMLSF